eukprot:6024326-Prymnesium_polylepis.1
MCPSAAAARPPLSTAPVSPSDCRQMYQRQLFKTQLADEAMEAGRGVHEGAFTRDELRALFSYDETT